MTETGYFQSGGNRLFYCYKPPTRADRAVGVVFVHATDGNRLGPHRMFVEAEKRFRELGFHTFRFDLSGCGDSEGEQAVEDISQNVFDVVNAVNYFENQHGIRKIVLFGVSRGSRIAYHLLFREGLPLAGMILLSAPISGGRVALKSFSNMIREYGYKLRTPQYLVKLVRGGVDFTRIGLTLLKALGLRSRYASSPKKTVAVRCPVLIIFGEKDPLTAESLDWYTDSCRRNGLPHEVHVIANANHSFFHYRWKEEIFALCESWMTQFSQEKEHDEIGSPNWDVCSDVLARASRDPSAV